MKTLTTLMQTQTLYSLISIPENESEDNYNADPGSVSEESDGEVLAA